MLLILSIVFCILLILGMPVSFSLGLASLAAMLYDGLPLFLLVRKMYSGIDVFVLVAVPLFVLAANIMNASGITDRLIRLADLMVGRIPGGLGHTNVLASTFFAGISGTALADATGLGAVEIKMMEEAGYDKDFSAAVTAASAIVGPIIPPSIMMIIYSFIAGNVSIISMFVAGIVPGILISLALMGMVYLISVRRNYPRRTHRIPWKEALGICKDGLVAIIMPLIIVVGIRAGIFTPTEAAAAAVLYALIVGLFVTRELKVSTLPRILLDLFLVTSVIFLIISTATVVAYLLTVGQVGPLVAGWITAMTAQPWLFLLLTMLLFLVLGAVMEPVAAMIIAVPIFAPLATHFGIDPLQFGILIVVNLSIGCITPPIGTSLYAVAAVAHMDIERLAIAIIPFILLEIGILFLLAYVPEITLVLPHFLGLR